MTLSEKSTPPSYSTGISNERRASDSSTTFPPSYETVVAVDHASAITSDEKKDNYEPLHRSHSNDSSQSRSSIPRLKGKDVYKETPPAFSRVPVVQNLEAFSLIDVPISGSARSLDKGLPSGTPRTSQVPHPFEQRDISESDWNRFIQDLRDGTSIPKCLGSMVLVPATIGMGPGAYFLNKAIKAKVRAKKLRYAISLINTWNQSFFVPRRVEVVLMRGEKKLTTAEPIAESQNLTNRNNQSSESEVDSTSKEHHCCKRSQVPLKLVVISIAEPAATAIPVAIESSS